MKKTYIIAAIAALFTIMPHTSSASNGETEQPATVSAADSLAMVDAKVSTLEKIVSKLPDISGFIQFQYAWENSDPVMSQFRIRRARLTLAGKIYKSLADYNFMAEFAGSPKLLDAFIRITPWKQLNLQVGSFRPSFTLENFNYGATSMELIDYPQIVSKMTTLGDITGLGSGAAGRDIGLQLYGGFFNKGGFSILQYYAGIYNGHGLDFNGINSTKDFAGMLRINPVKDLALIGSVYLGKWACDGAGTYATRNRWSAGFMFDDKKFFARGEYICGDTGGLTDSKLLVPTNGADLHTDGAYLQLGVWFWEHRIAPVVRADYYTQNTEARNDTTDICYTAGVDFRPWKYLRFQLNYTAKTYSYDPPPGDNGRRSMGSVVMASLTGLF